MKIQSPWMGRVRGSAGQMTGSKVYDKNVLRAKAFEVNNPNTSSQQSERGFFRQVQGVAATVSDELLRTLFGSKPKKMSRRNALTSQLTAAYTMNNGVKSFDFAQLKTVGNGKKVHTPIFPVVDGVGDSSVVWDLADVNGAIKNTTNVIVVFFNTSKNAIEVFNCSYLYTQDSINGGQLTGLFGEDSGYAYVTCEENGNNVYLRGFGSFIIKTRAEEKGSAPQPTPPTPTALPILNLEGTKEGDAVSIDFSALSPSSISDVVLIQDEKEVANFELPAVNNIVESVLLTEVDGESQFVVEAMIDGQMQSFVVNSK